jgi:hypothetical protein
MTGFAQRFFPGGLQPVDKARPMPASIRLPGYVSKLSEIVLFQASSASPERIGAAFENSGGRPSFENRHWRPASRRFTRSG